MSFSVYQDIVQKLAMAQIPSPRLEARLLIGAVLKQEPDEITTATCLDEKQQWILNQMLAKRLEHQPLDKILGYKDFYKYRFKVNNDVLSPRPDTEILVENAIKLACRHDLKNVLDLGTGSGCILCSILKDCPQMRGQGVDQSTLALNIALQNLQNLAIDNRAKLVKADWFAKDFTAYVKGKFDLIVSNPPYIPSSDIQYLQEEVKNYDPLAALDGGYDGLDSYRKIAEHVRWLIADYGFVLIEAGIGEAEDIIKIFEKQTFLCQDIINDLSGIQRCIIFRKKDCN